MLIIQQKTRRDFLRLSANSFLGAAALATLPALSTGAAQSRDGLTQTHRGELGRFKSIDEALERGVSNGTVAGVVALAADSRGIVYDAAYGKRDLAGPAFYHSWYLTDRGNGCQFVADEVGNGPVTANLRQTDEGLMHR